MAGYSGTPLPKKLGVDHDKRVLFANAPDGFAKALGKLPDTVQLKKQLRGPLDLIVFFTTGRADLERRLAKLASALDSAGSLWIAWPKRSSGVPTDLTEDVLREVILPIGLVDTKVCAIDETWSGLRFVFRKTNR